MNLQEIRREYPQYNDLSDQELSDNLYNKFYTDIPREEFNNKIGYTSTTTSPEQEQGTIDQVMEALRSAGDAISNMDVKTLLQYVKENQSLPGGIGGTITGAILGFLSPIPGGTIIGGILGGGIGSGAGSISSDITMDRDVDIAKALTEAGISIGADLAFLGLGKIAKPGYAVIKAMMKKGDTAEDIVKKLADGTLKPDGSVTKEIAESQELAESVGASLTPVQLGGASSNWETAKELLGRTGILSRGVFEDNLIKITDLVKKRQNELLKNTGGILPNSVIGEGMMDATFSGAKALSRTYGEGLDPIKKSLASQFMDVKSFKSYLTKYSTRKEFADELGVTMLNDDTVKVINKLTDSMGDTTQASASYLISIEKRLTNAISELGDFGSKNYNPNAIRELEQLRNKVQANVRMRMVKLKGGKQIKADYKKLQQTYGDARNILFPAINKNFVTAAKRETWEAVGAMLAHPNKTESVTALLKSIDQAYIEMGKKGSRDSDLLKGLSFKTAAEAKAVVKRSYIEKILPNSNEVEMTTEGIQKFAQGFKKVANNLKNDVNFRETAKKILGNDYNNFRKTVNLMERAAKKPEGGLATLFLRSKEYQSGRNVAGALMLGTKAVSGLIEASTVALGPRRLAKTATDPNHIRKLIKIDQGWEKNPKHTGKLITVLLDDIADDVYEEVGGEENIVRKTRRNPYQDNTMLSDVFWP
jgi:hypothetical protein